MIGAQSDSIGTDAGGSEPMAGDESNGSVTRVSEEVKSVFGSIAAECAASVAGSIHPSSDGAILFRIEGQSSCRCDLPNIVRRQS